MKLWQTNKHIFGWYYKKWFLLKIAKPLNLKCYRDWKKKKNRKRHKFKTHNSYAKRQRVSDQLHCGICKQKFKENDRITLDHKIPKCKLPKKLWERKENHQLAHYQCNELKGDKL